MTSRIFRLALRLGFAAGPVAVAAPADAYLAHAANGDGIPAPLSHRAYTVEIGGGTVVVPEGMVYIPAAAELPAYFIGKYEVTNAEYRAFVAATGRAAPRAWRAGGFPAGKAAHPVVDVSLADAEAYCAWVGRQTGRKAALPTAAQWEKAARGPKNFDYPWGDAVDTTYDRATGRLAARANYNAVATAELLRTRGAEKVTFVHERSPRRSEAMTAGTIAAYDAAGRATPWAVAAGGGVVGWANHETFTGFLYTSLARDLLAEGGFTLPVGSFPAGRSAYGCDDLAGNASEWTISGTAAAGGTEAGRARAVLRGGSWSADAAGIRATGGGDRRAHARAETGAGFRLVVNP